MPKYQTTVRFLDKDHDIVAGVHDLPAEIGDKLVAQGKAVKVSDLSDEAQDAAKAEEEAREAEEAAAKDKAAADAEASKKAAALAAEKAVAAEKTSTPAAKPVTTSKTTSKS